MERKRGGGPFARAPVRKLFETEVEMRGTQDATDSIGEKTVRGRRVGESWLSRDFGFDENFPLTGGDFDLSSIKSARFLEFKP